MMDSALTDHQNLKTVQKMIKFLSILGLVAFVAAKSYEDYGSSEEIKEEGDDEGLCFDGLEVALGCTVGTEFGDKLSMALMTCMGDEAEEATRSLNRRRGKGKGKKGKGKRGKGKGKGKGRGDDSMMDKCEYKPEEIDEMMELGMEVASYKCFQKIFNKSCKGFVSAHIQGYFEELSAGRR